MMSMHQTDTVAFWVVIKSNRFS